MTFTDPSRRSRRFAVAPMPDELLARYCREGLSSDDTLAGLLQRAGTRWPELPAVSDEQRALSYGQLLDDVGRVAGWFGSVGVRPGDVIMWQAPNWWEAVVVGFAIWHAGAVSNPVMPFCREHELAHMMAELEPDVVVAPRSFRGHDHVAMFESALAATAVRPKARLALRGRAPGWSSYDDVVSARPVTAAVVGPDDVALVMYTSGSTSTPKGVLHSARTLLSETRQLTSFWGWSADDRVYGASPLPHLAGMLRGMTCPISVGASVVIADGWDAQRAAHDIARHRITASGGATVFLQELTEVVRAGGERLGLTMWSCGGSSVPPEALRAADECGIPAFRIYGMTEMPTVSLSNRAYPLELRAETDGVVAPGVDVETIGADGRTLPVGAEGELRVRGPERMLGYLGVAGAGVDDGGWFRTGDLGRVDAAGNVRITGRVKDIVNRGGEKISARELETVIGRHPSVQHVAIVPGDHPRFGEVPIAFVVLRSPVAAAPGDELDAFLLRQGLPKQKLPTRWHVVETLPITDSGKVKKQELIERHRELSRD